MQKLTVCAAFAAALLAVPAKADSLKPDFPICSSRGQLGEMYQAILRQDMPGMDFLFDHGCFMTRAGVQVSLLDQHGAEAHVRVYGGKQPVEAWVSVGAVQP